MFAVDNRTNINHIGNYRPSVARLFINVHQFMRCSAMCVCPTVNRCAWIFFNRKTIHYYFRWRVLYMCRLADHLAWKWYTSHIYFFHAFSHLCVPNEALSRQKIIIIELEMCAQADLANGISLLVWLRSGVCTFNYQQFTAHVHNLIRVCGGQFEWVATLFA